MKILLIFLILLCPLPGIIFGIYIASHNEMPVIVFSSNIIAFILGIPLALLLGLLQIQLQRHLIIVSLLVLGLMASTLLVLDVSGVNRWISIGIISINISVVLSPFILYVVSASLARHHLLSVILIILVSAIHVFQPDAGQATAFGFAAMTILILTRAISLETRLIGIIVTGAGIILSWCQADPLPAVEYVEHILHLAIRIGWLGYAGIIFSIVSLLIPMQYTLRYRRINSHSGILSISFIIYLTATFCVTELGNYPVPVIGAGASPILGWYTIIGLTVIPSIFKLVHKDNFLFTTLIKSR